MHRSYDPIMCFYRLIEQARLPQRADRSAAGTLPTRAYRYCEAVTAAATAKPSPRLRVMDGGSSHRRTSSCYGTAMTSSGSAPVYRTGSP